MSAASHSEHFRRVARRVAPVARGGLAARLLRSILPGWLGLSLLSSVVCASPAGVEAARRALIEGVPQVAIYKLRTVLAQKSIQASERNAANRLLAEAQIAAGEPAEALATLAIFTDAGDVESTLLRAHAYAALGRWAEALPIYQALNGHPAALPMAGLGEAESLQAQGRTAEAAAVLERLLAGGYNLPRVRLRLASLLVELDRTVEAARMVRETDAGRPVNANWRRYIEARIHLREGRPAEAREILDQILATPGGKKPAWVPANLLAAATLALADAVNTPDNPEPGQKVLEAFIRANPESPQLELVFRRLDQLYAAEGNSTESALHSFYEDLPPRASALGKFYVTRMQIRQRDYAKAETSIEQFLSRFPGHPLTAAVHGLKADLVLLTNPPDALAAAEQALDAAARTAVGAEARAEYALRTALVNLRQGQFVRAASHLATAREAPRLRQAALFNGALAWLMQRNHERFAEALEAFSAESAEPLLAGQLRLEQGLVMARSDDADAPRVLRAFLKDFPAHPRRAEAQLACAELGFAAGRPEEAEAFVEAALAAPDETGETAGRAEYLAVFLEDSKTPRDEARVILLAREFIAKHPQSPHLADVRMKLGEVFFKAESYLDAQEQFETLARERPDGPLAETALYLAGQCAMKLINAAALNHGLGLFDRVAERKGPLEPYARLQQAVIKNRLGSELDAVKVYDAILSAATPVPADVRYAAHIGRGDSLVALAQATEPAPAAAVREKHLADAIASYDALLALPSPPPEWRNQAAYKRAKALAQLGRGDEALAALYDVLAASTTGPRETFWYAKAGFDAAGMLEAARQWKSAADVYEKMARFDGPHAAQARERARTLKLEHFLWE